LEQSEHNAAAQPGDEQPRQPLPKPFGPTWSDSNFGLRFGRSDWFGDLLSQWSVRNQIEGCA
jgi:hypothetical protein